jgi:hypothetical protein
VYLQKEQPESNYWYYCQNPQGYHPYIKSCPGGLDEGGNADARAAEEDHSNENKVVLVRSDSGGTGRVRNDAIGPKCHGTAGHREIS